jgi:diketogulonate reductase-like aldo/keto reductase
MSEASVQTPVVKIPKAEAIERITKNLAAVRVQLAASKAQLLASAKGEKYALHFQVDAFKKQANFFKAQIARIKKEPKTELIWDARFGA